MELVVDANILFSALINHGVILYSPEFVLEEFTKYSSLIQKKMKRTKEEFVSIMHQLHQIIAIIPQEEYEAYLEKARRISPDKDDVMYFALALKKNCAIWSNDAALKEQGAVAVYNTKEVVEIMDT